MISSCISNRSATGFSKRSAHRCLPLSGIDKLYVYPKPVAGTLYRAFEHVADIQLAPDQTDID